MNDSGTIEIIEAYKAFIGKKNFPCIAARAALASEHLKCMVAGNMACPKDDELILNFLYCFVDSYRHAGSAFHSAAIIFKSPVLTSEEEFDTMLWQRLQSLANMDAAKHAYDHRVAA